MSAANFIVRATGRGRRQVHYVVTIDGVPGAFTDRADESTPSAPDVDGRGMVVSFEESKVTLDRRQRLQVGGGAVVTLQDRDGILAALFAVRSRRATYVTANETASATTIDVANTGTLASAGVVYVAAETIAYTGKTATTLTGCTRGAYGSQAQAHRGGTEQGAGVYTVPPSWLGRRVRVVGYFDDDDGQPDTSTETDLGVFRLEESPTPLGNGLWELRCSHLSDELTRRKIGSGIRDWPTPGTLARFTRDGAVDLLTMTTVKGVGAALLQRSTALGMTQARVKFSDPDVSAIYDVYDVDTSGSVDVIRVRLPARTASGLDIEAAISNAARRVTVESIRPMLVLEGGVPYVMALSALTSVTGDGTNGTYDVMPGVEPTTLGGPGHRFGAGIPDDEVDVSSFTDTALSVPLSWTYPIDDEIPLVDFVKDFAREANAAAILTRSGELAMTPLVEERQTPVAIIAEKDCFGAITSVVVEEDTYARVEIDCNYDPLDGDYEGHVTVIDEEIAATYAPRENALVMESRSIVVTPVDTSGDNGSFLRPSVDHALLLPTLRRDMLASRGGSLVVTAKLSAKHVLLNLGDLVALSLPSVSDRRGGTLADAVGRVIERQNEWRSGDLSITVSVLVEERLFHFAPHAEIDSVDPPGAGLQKVYLSTTEVGNNAAPALSFRPGDVLTVVSADGLTVDIGYAEVDSVTDVATIVLKAGPVGDALPLVAGQFILLRSAAASVSSADGFDETDYTYHDGAALLVDVTSRWR
jgi:hypothetical protein